MSKLGSIAAIFNWRESLLGWFVFQIYCLYEWENGDDCEPIPTQLLCTDLWFEENDNFLRQVIDFIFLLFGVDVAVLRKVWCTVKIKLMTWKKLYLCFFLSLTVYDGCLLSKWNFMGRIPERCFS